MPQPSCLIFPGNIEKREQRLEEISDELLSTDGRGIDTRLKEIEAFVLSGLQNIQARLRRDPEGNGGTREALHRNYTHSRGDGYKLSGEWDLLGDVRSDGAGGAAQTDRDIRFTIKVAA